MPTSDDSNIIEVTTTALSGDIRFMTSLQNIQLLEPCPCFLLPVITPSASLATEEGGQVALVENVTEYEVLFLVEKLNTNYDFLEADITNEIDGDNQLEIGFSMTERTVLGFRLILDANPDTANYQFLWRVQIITV